MLSSSTVDGVQRDCSTICWQTQSQRKECKRSREEKFERSWQKDGSRVSGLIPTWVTHVFTVLFGALDKNTYMTE